MSEKLKILDMTNPRHIEHNEHQDGSIARKGSVPKHSNDGPIPHSWGTTSRQKDAAGIGGMGSPVAVVDGGQAVAASAAAPLAHTYGSAPDLKTGKIVPPYPGQRSRTNEGVESHGDKVQHGRDMIAGAVKGGGRS
jgi:hypothetical protein